MDEGFQIFTFVCPLRPFLRLPLSPRCALLFITIAVLLCYVPIALVFSIYDSTEVAIQKMIEASQRMITVGSSTEAIEGAPSIGMTPATKRHLELQIKTLRNAPRDPDKLESLLKNRGLGYSSIDGSHLPGSIYQGLTRFWRFGNRRNGGS
jgi:hypothetical protein